MDTNIERKESQAYFLPCFTSPLAVAASMAFKISSLFMFFLTPETMGTTESLPHQAAAVVAAAAAAAAIAAAAVSIATLAPFDYVLLIHA